MFLPLSSFSYLNVLLFPTFFSSTRLAGNRSTTVSIIQDDVSPLNKNWEEKKRAMGIDNVNNTTRRDCLPISFSTYISQSQVLKGEEIHDSTSKSLGQSQAASTAAKKVINTGPTSPVESVAPWLLREDQDSVANLEESGCISKPVRGIPKPPTKRVAPLMTHGLLPGRYILPVLERDCQEELNRGESSWPLSSPPLPSPLPKSGDSDTMGCADLPPPPPPSHSPAHKYKVQFLMSRREDQASMSTTQSLAIVETSSTASSQAPTPISKGRIINSASSYPTLSNVSPGLSPGHMILPSPFSTRNNRRSGRNLLGSKNADDGSSRSLNSIRGTSSAGPARSSFIVFSLNRRSVGSSVSADRGNFLQTVEQIPTITSPSNYSHNQSQDNGSPMSVLSPEEVTQSVEPIRNSLWNAIGNPLRFHSKPGSAMESTLSFREFLDSPPKATSFASMTRKLARATTTTMYKANDKLNYRRSSSFDGSFRHKKEDLRHDSISKPSWLKFNWDSGNSEQMEEDSEQRIAEAQREIDEDAKKFNGNCEDSNEDCVFKTCRYYESEEHLTSRPASRLRNGEEGMKPIPAEAYCSKEADTYTYYQEWPNGNTSGTPPPEMVDNPSPRNRTFSLPLPTDLLCLPPTPPSH